MWTGHDEWHNRDRLVALAAEMYERSICPDCGQSAYIAGDGEYDGHFRITESRCMGCKAVEQWREAEDKKKSKPLAGLRHYLALKLHNPNG